MTAGRPINEAPRDGTEIIAETCNHYGIPETGHYAFAHVSFRDGWWKPIGADNHHVSDGCFTQWWPVGTPESDLEKTPRTNWNFRPSNGSHGEGIYSAWCENCIHERAIREDYDHAIANDLGCHIYLRTMAFDIGDPEYPTEWQYDRETNEPKCTAFVRDDGKPDEPKKPRPVPRCANTLELFPEKD